MDDVELDTLDDLTEQILEVTEKSMRDAIVEIPDGVYSYEGLVEAPETGRI